MYIRLLDQCVAAASLGLNTFYALFEYVKLNRKLDNVVSCSHSEEAAVDYFIQSRYILGKANFNYALRSLTASSLTTQQINTMYLMTPTQSKFQACGGTLTATPYLSLLSQMLQCSTCWQQSVKS